MKSAKIFLGGMYLHLVLSIAIPVGTVYFSMDGLEGLGIGIFLFYLVMIAAVWITGWVCVGLSAAAYRQNRADELLRSWKLLKLGAIPFYILNFLYSFVVWSVLTVASRGFFIVLVPIPVIITCSMIVQSGCIGICYIMYLRKQPENNGNPNCIHYALQLISIADIISTIIILKNTVEETLRNCMEITN